MGHYSIVNDKGRRVGRKSKFPIVSCDKGQRIMYQGEMIGFHFSTETIIRKLTKEGEYSIEIITCKQSQYPGYYQLYRLTVLASSYDKLGELILEAEEKVEKNKL